MTKKKNAFIFNYQYLPNLPLPLWPRGWLAGCVNYSPQPPPQPSVVVVVVESPLLKWRRFRSAKNEFSWEGRRCLLFLKGSPPPPSHNPRALFCLGVSPPSPLTPGGGSIFERILFLIYFKTASSSRPRGPMAAPQSPNRSMARLSLLGAGVGGTFTHTEMPPSWWRFFFVRCAVQFKSVDTGC